MDWKSFYVSSLGHNPSSSNPASVVNLFKLSKEYTPPDQRPNSPKADLAPRLNAPKITVRHVDDVSFVNYQKDIQLWDRDKSAVIDIVTRRLRNMDDGRNRHQRTEAPQTTHEEVAVPSAAHEPDVVMSSECEVLLSWFDRYLCDGERTSEEAQRVFVENAAKLLTNSGLNPMNFLKFLIDIGKLASNKGPNFMQRYLRVSLKHLQREAYGSMHISILNANGVFVNSLVFNEDTTPAQVLKTFVECADLVFPAQPNFEEGTRARGSEFYFFLAYLLFRSGAAKGLDMLAQKERGLEPMGLDPAQFPRLFTELCEILRDLLLEKDNEAKRFLLGQFSTEYFPGNARQGAGALTRGPNHYARLLLSVVYPDYYPHLEPSTLDTREDFLWYQLHLILGNTGGNLVLASHALCNTLTQQVNEIRANDPDVTGRIFAYAHSIALAGGLMEALRLLMSAAKLPDVQTFAVFFLVYFENLGILEVAELKYVAHTLWNVNERESAGEELSYLVQLAFNHRRRASPELKILLAAVSHAPRADAAEHAEHGDREIRGLRKLHGGGQAELPGERGHDQRNAAGRAAAPETHQARRAAERRQVRDPPARAVLGARGALGERVQVLLLRAGRRKLRR